MRFIAEKIIEEWSKKMPEQASEIDSNNFLLIGVSRKIHIADFYPPESEI